MRAASSRSNITSTEHSDLRQRHVCVATNGMCLLESYFFERLLPFPVRVPLSSLADQDAAIRLAICNDIGEASYTTSLVAADFVDQIREHEGTHSHTHTTARAAP